MANNTPFKFELGDQVEDIVTGFKGTVSMRAQYITGCNAYAIAPKSLDGTTLPESQVLDENRIKLTPEGTRLLVDQPVKEEEKGGPHVNSKVHR